MRDCERIEKIINILQDIWKENPNWRFGQLISNVIGEILKNNHKSDMFFPEDDFWLKNLQYYKESHSIFNYGQNILKENTNNESEK